LECLLHEEYVEDNLASMRRVFYALKPLIPRSLQLALRRRYVVMQKKRAFPAWPVETRLPELVAQAVDDALKRGGIERLLAIAPWPQGARFAFCITHDVEWDEGLRSAPALLDVETRIGVVSSWNLVPERYPIDWGIVQTLRDAGCEIGIHGLRHDGRLFQSKSIFHNRLSKIEHYANEW